MVAVLLAAMLAAALLGCAGLAYLLFSARQKLVRYAPIRDVDEYRAAAEREVTQQRAQVAHEVAGAQQAVARQRQAFEQETVSGQQQLAHLRDQVAGAQQQLAALTAEVRSVEEELEAQSFGFYRPHYDLGDSDQYQHALKQVREQQKRMVSSGGAAHCPANWTVDGSVAKGRKMVNEQMKLMLRAFNGECDAAIAKVRYNNATKMEARVKKSCEAINTLGKSKSVWITQDYLNLKLHELYLTHEHHEVRQQEQETQREIREQMREEQKALKEIESAKTSAEKEEARYQKALDQARAELARASGAQHERFAGLVQKLEDELSAAIDRKAKAIARAQLTRSGHVYVISNIGSFGKGVFKIGMTRRLEPHIRVRELGDASVPFLFDVHAMIYSEDAPALERSLHMEFDDRRVNRVNARKEFFRVTLDEIRQAVARHHGIITFVLHPEAEEYRKTISIESDSQAAAS